tara:strand:+ start:599 stop:1159 length:561 start_codon:yes stop_codon:yes gene_type:complete
MNKSHLVKQWKKTYGENFKVQYGGVFKKLPFHFSKKTLVRIWYETYGEKFEHEYPQVFKLLGVNEGVTAWKTGDKIKYKATKTGKWRKGKISKKLSSGKYELDSGKIVYEKDPDATKENKMKLTKSKLKEMVREELLSEGANMRYKLMDKLVKTMGNHKKALEELFKTMSDKEAKDNVEYILRMWS